MCKYTNRTAILSLLDLFGLLTYLCDVFVSNLRHKKSLFFEIINTKLKNLFIFLLVVGWSRFYFLSG